LKITGCPFVLFILVIVLSVLRFTDSDYPFVILNLFVQRFCKYLFYIWSTPLTIPLAGGKIQYNKQYLVQRVVNNVTTRYKKLYVRVLCGITSIKNIIVTHKRDIIQLLSFDEVNVWTRPSKPQLLYIH